MMNDDLGSIRRIYGLNVVDVDLPTVMTQLVAVKAATRVIVLRTAVFTPSVFNGGTIQFIDDVTGAVVGTLTVPTGAAGNGVDQLRLEEGSAGTRLSPGANLALSVSGAVAGRLHVETYQKFH